MKQTARILSTYTADVSGVCSALYELGGMTVMHDASGCNSTYNTHDEPRWYDMDSLVFISAITEMDAIMGDDEKLIGDIVSAARELHPRFIAIAGTPIPMMIGTDLDAAARLVEERTGIPAFGISTNGMHTYISGAGIALEQYGRRFVTEKKEKTDCLSINLLGVTPLDFSVNGSVESMHRQLTKRDIEVLSCWAMGDTPEQLEEASRAHVNVCVSACGIPAARYLQEQFGIPYIVGRPCGDAFTDTLAESIRKAAGGGSPRPLYRENNGAADIVLIGEGVYCASLAKAIQLETGKNARCIAAAEFESALLSPHDRMARDEDEIIPLLRDARIVIADPLYRPICPETVHFVPMGHEAFSGRIFRKDIPDLTESLDLLKAQLS